jgi:hypothetical protein
VPCRSSVRFNAKFDRNSRPTSEFPDSSRIKPGEPNMRSVALTTLVALPLACLALASTATAQDRRPGRTMEAPRSAGLSRPARVGRAVHSDRFAYRARVARGTSYGYRHYAYRSRPFYGAAYYGYGPAYYRAYPYRSYVGYGYAPAYYRSGDYCDW